MTYLVIRGKILDGIVCRHYEPRKLVIGTNNEDFLLDFFLTVLKKIGKATINEIQT